MAKRKRTGMMSCCVTGMLALVLAGCHSSSDSGSEDRAGLDVSELARIVDRLSAEMAVPGTLVLVRTPEVTWRYAYGSRVAGADEPLTVADHVRIGSNTKTMVGTALLQLVEDGQLSLDDPVTSLLPDYDAVSYPVLQDVTVRQVLDMRSGLGNYSEELSFNQALDEQPDRVWQPTELAELGLTQPAEFAPGEGFLYSNTNTVLAGLIVEELTGKPLREVLDDKVFAPLGLEHTSLPAVDDASIPSPHPRGYMFGDNVSTLGDGPTLTPAEQDAARAGELLPNDVTFLNPSWGWAAGAAISTIDDLAIYVEALVDGGLLGEELQAERLASIEPIHPEVPDGAAYGMALAQFGPMLGHDGSLPGFQSFMGHDPNHHATVIVVTNLQFGAGDEQPANEIARALLGEL